MVEQNRSLSDYWSVVRKRVWLLIVWRIVRRRIWLLIAFAVIGAGLAAAFSVMKTPTYLARAKVVVNPLVSATSATVTMGEVAMETEVEVVPSVQVAELVRKNLHTATPVNELLKGIQVEVIGDSTVMYVGYEAPDPDAAQKLADAFAVAYLENRVVRDRETLDGKIARTQDSVDRFLAKIDSAKSQSEQAYYAAKVVLTEAKMTDLQKDRKTLEGGRIFSRATLPESPTGISLPLAMVIGAALGVLLGAILAIHRGLR